MARLAPAELAALVSAGALEPEEESLAVESLGDAGDPRALLLARERLDRPEPEVRATAARVLGKLRDRESLGALLRALEDPEWYVRAVAARGLEQLPGDAEVAAHLRPLLTDRAWWVRANAARTLSRRGEPGVGALIGMVASQDRYARDAALAALALVELPEDAAGRLEVVRAAAARKERPREAGPTEHDA